jgi:hypothetical protein
MPRRSVLTFTAATLLLLFAFIASERGFAPSFIECLNRDGQSAAASVGTVASAYVSCTGIFVDANSQGITALATLVIAAFTATLWLATSRQARLTREAFVADKRAFVFATGFNQVWEQDKATNLYVWRLRPVLRNSGATPTKDMEMYVACEIRNSQLPTGYAFTPQAQNIAKGMMPPMFELQGGIAPQYPGAAITPQDIIDSQAGRKFIYLWGWISYRDIFPETERHITRYCWLITAIGDPLKFDPNAVGRPPVPGTLAFSNAHHPEGNSIDDATTARD